MNLQDTLNKKLTQSRLKDIAQLMGYHGETSQAVRRIQYLLSDEFLGLNDGAFDQNYTDQQFLLKLCDVLNIGIEQYQKCIDAIDQQRALKNYSFKSYLLENTDFKRQNESIYMLGANESSRNIKLASCIRKQSLEDQIPLISAMIKKHYEEAHGNLPLWGEIKRYTFFHEKEEYILFNPDG